MIPVENIQPYQQVEGLQTIYVGSGATPRATFVFASEEAASKAGEGIVYSSQHAYAQGMGKQVTDNTITDLLEVLRSHHLIEGDLSRMLSYCAKTGAVNSLT